MKIVCDTNVLISGILFGGNARDILRLAARGRLINCISAAIIRETEEVLARPKFNLSAEQVMSITTLFRDTFELVLPEKRIRVIDADPDDDRILEAAHAAEAEVIVSGDQHLLALGSWRKIRILAPADFMREFGDTMAS